MDFGKIIEKQVTAYNNKDIDAFLGCFTREIKIYNFPKTIMMDGIHELEDFFSKRFSQTTPLKCEVVNRIKVKNTIIDHEIVSGIAEIPMEFVVMYGFYEDKISEVYYLVKP
jgi:hypothetical protein